MKISYNWLREFVECDLSPKEVADILTFLGFESEGITHLQRSVDGVVVGHVVESRPHPNADKLKVTKVDIGGEILPIVCGAPNCREDLHVAVAPVGVRIGDMVIDSREIRGERSAGMILSESEMGISDNHDGVVELPSLIALGSRLDKMIQAEDWIMDFEITVNRPDALSHLGIARELAAHLGQPLKMPEFRVQESDVAASDLIDVEILDPEQGPRYVARVVDGIRVGQSPLWMKARLHSLGQRPVNNIVDATNYILFELGHPLHAFDYNLIADHKILVRLARAGESMTTLDGRERALSPEDLLIADPEKPVALAGVMGGENSEVEQGTRRILIEAAHFDPPTVRRTAKRLGMSTEASRRFERGADPNMPPKAAARCAELIRNLAGGTVCKGEVDAYPRPIKGHTITFRPSQAINLLGLTVPRERMMDIFQRLELDSEMVGSDEMRVNVPTFRPDLEREVDLIEEVARHVGYDKIPTAYSSKVLLKNTEHPLEGFVDAALDSMVTQGFREAVSSAMTSGQDQELFDGGLQPYTIERPISPEMGVYRASLLPALLRAMEHNLDQGYKNLRLVETGQIGGKGWFGIESDQREHLAFAVSGSALLKSFDSPERDFDVSDLKTVLSSLFRHLSLDISRAFSYDKAENLALGLKLLDGAGVPYLIGGLLRKEVAARYGIEEKVYVCEIDLERLLKQAEEKLKRPGLIREYVPLSRYPASTRDIAIVAPTDLPAGKLEEELRGAAGELLESLELFDLYEGKPLAANERSLAYRLVFRSWERTLTDEEVDELVKGVVRALTSYDNVRLRGE